MGLFLFVGFMPIFFTVGQYLTTSNDSWSVLNSLALLLIALFWVIFTVFLGVATIFGLQSSEEHHTQPVQFLHRSCFGAYRGVSRRRWVRANKPNVAVPRKPSGTLLGRLGGNYQFYT